MAKTKIIFCDPHFGDKSKADDFQYEDLFLGFLDRFSDASRFDVIGAGDLWELLQCCANRIAYYRAPIIKKMRAMKNLTLLPGNHDWIMSRYLPEVYEADGVHVEHGHRFDIYNANPSKIGSAIAKAVGWFERLIHRDTDEWLMDLARIKGKITPASAGYPGSYKEYREGAEGIIKSSKCDVCVFGHTHKAIIEPLIHGYYVNAGRWRGKEIPTYAMVTDKEIRLCEASAHSILERAVR